MQVARGGSDGILRPTLDDKLTSLHEAIASLAEKSKYEEAEEEHVLENFHSSRTIRKLILDCPAFAATLWKNALKGKCKSWASGHRFGVGFPFTFELHAFDLVGKFSWSHVLLLGSLAVILQFQGNLCILGIPAF